MNRVLTIAGSDSSGGAGIQADLKTLAALGVYGMSAIAALTAQNTLGVHGFVEVAPEFVAQQIDAVVTDIGVDAVKTGMLANAAIVEVVAAKVREHALPNLVVDPVIIAKHGRRMLTEDAVGVLKQQLLPLTTVVTPNLPEAEALTGFSDLRDAARALHGLGARNVVIKGGHCDGAPIDLLFDGERFVKFPGERLASPNTHGTGCVFASAIAARLAQGHSVVDAVALAKAFVTEAIRNGLALGHGIGPVNPLSEPRT